MSYHHLLTYKIQYLMHKQCFHLLGRHKFYYNKKLFALIFDLHLFFSNSFLHFLINILLLHLIQQAPKVCLNLLQKQLFLFFQEVFLQIQDFLKYPPMIFLHPKIYISYILDHHQAFYMEFCILAKKMHKWYLDYSDQ